MNTRRLMNGFTVVEMLAVVLVIGILAGISVVSYGAWQQRQADNLTKSEALTALQAMQNYKNFKGAYPTNIDTFMNKKSPEVTLEFANPVPSGMQFCIQATSVKINTIKYYVSDTVKDPQSGTCPAT